LDTGFLLTIQTLEIGPIGLVVNKFAFGTELALPGILKELADTL
jgi:hypothetical protein